MKQYEIKDIENSTKDVDAATRRVKVSVSKMGNKDLDGDIIDHAAYNSTITQRGPKGSNLIWHLSDHYPSLKYAIGKPSEVMVEGDYLNFVTDIPKTAWGDDMLELYKAGAINQHSVGFRTIKSEPMEAGTNNEYRLIKEILLYEGSAVTWAANPATPTVWVGKSGIENDSRTEFDKTFDDLSTVHKMYKCGHLTDQTYELLEMKLNQLTEKLKQLFQETNQPATPAVDPVKNSDEALMKALITFSNKLKV